MRCTLLPGTKDGAGRNAALLNEPGVDDLMMWPPSKPTKPSLSQSATRTERRLLSRNATMHSQIRRQRNQDGGLEGSNNNNNQQRTMIRATKGSCRKLPPRLSPKYDRSQESWLRERERERARESEVTYATGGKMASMGAIKRRTVVVVVVVVRSSISRGARVERSCSKAKGGDTDGSDGKAGWQRSARRN